MNHRFHVLLLLGLDRNRVATGKRLWRERREPTDDTQLLRRAQVRR